MKSIIAIALISLAFCGFINQEEVDFLKANAPFEVYEPEKNPFRDYTEEQIRDLFTVQLEYPEGIEVEEEEDDAPESFDFRTNGQTVLEKSETKLHAGHAGPSQVL